MRAIDELFEHIGRIQGEQLYELVEIRVMPFDESIQAVWGVPVVAGPHHRP